MWFGYGLEEGEFDCSECESSDVSGTYNLTGVNVLDYSCSENLILGSCFTDQSASEDNCPTGMCTDSDYADESGCTDNGEQWITHMCLDCEGNGTEDSGQEECESSGNNWVSVGWNDVTTLITVMEFGGTNLVATLNEDYSATNSISIFEQSWSESNGQISISESGEPYCESNCNDENTYTNEQECEDNDGTWREPESEPIIWINNGDGTITNTDISEPECSNSMIEDQDECESNGYEWDPGQCVQITLTKQ